jgi:hypothetical protein
MKRWLVLLVFAACSDEPLPSWDDAVSQFASAHCTWNASCNDPTLMSCEANTRSVLSDQTRPELGANENACIACLVAWTKAYDASTVPCMFAVPPAEAAKVHDACKTVNCVASHPLPGTTPAI